MKKTIITVLKFAISFGILFYLFQKEMRNDQFSVLADGAKNWLFLICGVSCTFLAIMTGLFRWKVFVNGIQLPFRYRDALKIGLMGQFFNLFAFGMLGGDALRAYYLTRIFQRRGSEIIATVIVDRMIGMLTMFGIGSLAFWMFDVVSLADQDPNMLSMITVFGWTISVITILGIFAGLILFFMPNFHQLPFLRPVFRIPKLGSGLAKGVGVASVYRSRPGIVVVGIGLSILANLLFGLAIYSVSRGISDSTPSLVNHLFIEPIVMCSNAVPLPGGVGGMEFMLNLMYRAFGSPHGIVVAFTYRFCLLLVAATGGIIWMFNREMPKTMRGQLDGSSNQLGLAKE